MSTLALMRFLESAPARYDAGMRLLTLGRVTALHDALAAAAAPAPGARVLEIGCGTGSVTRRLVARGATVTAVDQDPAMLDRARASLAGTAGTAGAQEGTATFRESTASEIDALPDGAFDAVVASLVLSEMSADERLFVLREAARLVRPGGVVAVGDEVRPRRPGQRIAAALLRAPQAAVGWLLVGSVSKPLADPAAELERVGLRVTGERRWLMGSLAALTAERPA